MTKNVIRVQIDGPRPSFRLLVMSVCVSKSAIKGTLAQCVCRRAHTRSQVANGAIKVAHAARTSERARRKTHHENKKKTDRHFVGKEKQICE